MPCGAAGPVYNALVLVSSPAPLPPRWHPAVRSLLYLIAFAVIQVAASVAVFLALRRLGGDAGLSGGAVLLVFAVTAPPLLVATRAFLRLFDRRGLASLGVRWPVGGRPAALRQAVRAVLAVMGLVAGWLAVLALLPGAAVRFGGRSGDLSGPAGLLGFTALLAGFLVQGAVEELAVRGYIYHALRERWRPAPAAVTSSLLFAALHGANPGFSPVALLNTFLAGVIFAILVERSGSLWSAVVAHGVWNFAVSCLLSLPVSGVSLPHLLVLSVQGPDLLTGDGFGPEGSLLLSLLALPVAALLTRRRRGGDPRTPPTSPGDVRPPSPSGGGVAQPLL